MIAYHLRQPFVPGEIIPEEANRLGCELAKRFTKGNHAYIVCTHIDKAHIHNHVIWNSTALSQTCKFRNFWGSSRAVRRLNDTICIENGYSIAENPKRHGKSCPPFGNTRLLLSYEQRLVRYLRKQKRTADGFQLHGNLTPRAVFARPCSLSAAPHRLNTAARPDCDCKGVSPHLCIVARRLPCPLFGLVDIARLVGGSWRAGRMAQHRRECIRLLYAAPGFAGLSLSRSKGLSRTERGACGQIPSEFSSGRNSG